MASPCFIENSGRPSRSAILFHRHRSCTAAAQSRNEDRIKICPETVNSPATIRKKAACDMTLHRTTRPVVNLRHAGEILKSKLFEDLPEIPRPRLLLSGQPFGSTHRAQRKSPPARCIMPNFDHVHVALCRHYMLAAGITLAERSDGNFYPGMRCGENLLERNRRTRG